MKTASKIAAAVMLVGALALPAFAGDQDLETLLATSGRSAGHHAGPIGGSMWMMHQTMHGTAVRDSVPPALRDFQLEGRQ